jgi:quinol monooxygenase YgiN
MKMAIPQLAGAVLAIGAMQSAHAQAPVSPAPNPDAPVYAVSYIDVLARQKSLGMTVLKQFRSACAGEAGNLRCEAIQRMEQQNEFAILEVWKDQKAYETHAAGAGAQLRDKLKPILASPYDERVHTALSVLPPQPMPSGRIVYAITHVDVIPPKVADTIPLLTQMAETARKEQGNGRLEVLQQPAPRANHFTVIEIWSNKRMLENHQAQAYSVQYRENLQPMIGALYDERIYKILD